MKYQKKVQKFYSAIFRTSVSNNFNYNFTLFTIYPQFYFVNFW